METFICIICNQPTISPRAHLPTHTIDDIMECFIRLTRQKPTSTATKMEEKIIAPAKKIENKTDIKKMDKELDSVLDLTRWDLKP